MADDAAAAVATLDVKEPAAAAAAAPAAKPPKEKKEKPAKQPKPQKEKAQGTRCLAASTCSWCWAAVAMSRSEACYVLGVGWLI
jgi:hypothetical protein